MSTDILQQSRKQGREMAQGNWSRSDVDTFVQAMQFPHNERAALMAAFLEQKQQAA